MLLLHRQTRKNISFSFKVHWNGISFSIDRVSVYDKKQIVIELLPQFFFDQIIFVFPLQQANYENIENRKKQHVSYKTLVWYLYI